jgi:3,4-dihydroxy-9,10-secoandrosta-1,3,5(10)-triene-9,17-dione 4,5-dioxygenase
MRLGADQDGAGGMRLQFYHCNPRHHSLALMEAPHPAGLVHLMIEARTLDEVGFALDRCHRAGVALSATLGRHTNDKMVSFYMKSPSVFDVEFGYGGIQLDVENVTTSEITSVSDWGHDFSVGFRD